MKRLVIKVALLCAGIISLMPVAESIGQVYDRSKLTRFDQKFTIGLERTVYSLYAPRGWNLSPKTTRAQDNCYRILLRMKLTRRFRIETGLSYKDIDRLLGTNKIKNKQFNLYQPCKLTVPLTIQYQLQSERSRLHPYIGAGIQYNYYDATVGGNTTDVLANKNISNSLKYLNIIVTQGLIYDVTPDLQITQSIHIIPENGIKPVGINLGIGYRLK